MLNNTDVNKQQVESVSALNIRSTTDYVSNHQHFNEESFQSGRMLKREEGEGISRKAEHISEECECSC